MTRKRRKCSWHPSFVDSAYTAARCNACGETLSLGPSNDAITYREFGLARDISSCDLANIDRHVEWWANRTESYVDEVLP